LAGEIHEFKQDLNAQDRGKKKDAVKKVIAGKQELNKTQTKKYHSPINFSLARSL
jgi:hypothetical protein